MLTFLYGWLFLLAPLPLLVRWLVPPRVDEQLAIRVPFFPRLLEAGGQRESHERIIASIVGRGGVWLFLLTALARPQWLEPPLTRSIPTRDLLLLVDLSGSMEQSDFLKTGGETVDRLSAAKDVLGDFLMKREGDRVGLVVFGNAPFLQVPFTTDLDLCRDLLNETQARMAGPKTSLGDAIGLGIKLFEKSDTPTKTIIALTDGNDTGSTVPPIEASRIAHDRGITIHTVAMGDPTTVGEEQLDEETLRSVATSAEGSYFLAMNQEQLANIYRKLDTIETREVQTVSFRPRRDLYFIPLAAALALSLGMHVAQVWHRISINAERRPAGRLRVNARTFELETIDI